MAIGQTTTTQVAPAPAAFYDRTLLERALPFLAHSLFGQQRPLPANNSSSIIWSRFNSLPKGTKLSEGVNPSPQQLSKTTVTGSVAGYGAYVEISEEVDLFAQDKTLTEAAEVLGENAGETLDAVYRDILAAGTSVYRAGNVARGSIVTKLTSAEIDIILLALKNAKAKFFKKMINPSTGVGTVPIADAYFGITSFEAARDLENILTTSWTPVHKYPDQKSVLQNEQGAYKNLRVLATTEAKVFADEGGTAVTNTLKYTTANTHCDVHTMLIFGMNAYGITPVSGKALQNIVKPASVVGGPLERFSTSGWKAFTGCTILVDAFMYRYEFGVSA